MFACFMMFFKISCTTKTRQVVQKMNLIISKYSDLVPIDEELTVYHMSDVSINYAEIVNNLNDIQIYRQKPYMYMDKTDLIAHEMEFLSELTYSMFLIFTPYKLIYDMLFEGIDSSSLMQVFDIIQDFQMHQSLKAQLSQTQNNNLKVQDTGSKIYKIKGSNNQKHYTANLILQSIYNSYEKFSKIFTLNIKIPEEISWNRTAEIFEFDKTDLKDFKNTFLMLIDSVLFWNLIKNNDLNYYKHCNCKLITKRDSVVFILGYITAFENIKKEILIGKTNPK